MAQRSLILIFFPGWSASAGTFKINKAKMLLFIFFCPHSDNYLVHEERKSKIVTFLASYQSSCDGQ